MSVIISVFIKNVKKGKTVNWLTFEADVSFFNANKTYKIYFCGTELYSSIPLTTNQKETLEELLIKDFGYAPYSIDKAKKIIGNGKQYIFKT